MYVAPILLNSNRPIQYPILFTSFCEVDHRATEHLNMPANNIYESSVGKKREKAACPYVTTVDT